MVGDRFYDIDGAKAVGVDSAGAVYGFGTEKELSNAGATYILNSPADLY
jgi:phosphoglycolate phosphatase